MERYTENNGLIQLHFVPSFFLQIPPGHTIGSVQGFAFVLDCISMLFRSLIPQIGQKPLFITNDPSLEDAICYRSLQRITLSTEPDLWCQIVYQFSHELCHYAILDDVDDNMRWFEESICAMASFFFLQMIGQYWFKTNISIKSESGEPYALSFIQYRENMAKKVTPFNLKDPAAIHTLESDCYIRPMNRYVATYLYDIFIAHPQTWSAVPLLCNVHQQSLHEALDAWILASPAAAQPGLLKIRALF